MSHARRNRTPVPLPRTAVWQDLDGVPEHLVGEIVNGELVTSPRPGFRHSRATSRLGAALDGPFDSGVGGPGGWVLLDEPYLRLGLEVRVPDLAGWRRDRFEPPLDRRPIEVVPDWICEVLSPDTELVDRGEKQDLYAAHGVQHLWLLNPAVPALEVYRLLPDGWLRVAVHDAMDRVRAEPFDALELDLSLLWWPSPPRG